LGKPAELIAKDDGKDVSSLMLRDVSINRPGEYVVTATNGKIC